jgi:hypothetical protein
MRRYFGLLLIVCGCATAGQRRALPEAVTQAIVTCTQRSESGCTVLMVDNGQLEDATIYLYGGRIGMVTGMKTSPLFIPNAMLHSGGLCAVISARLQTSWHAWQSQEACLTPGGYFALVLAAPFSASSLTPW